MDRFAVARMLREIGLLLEVQGGNPFYERGARALEALAGEIPGIGDALAATIREFHRTGRSESLGGPRGRPMTDSLSQDVEYLMIVRHGEVGVFRSLNGRLEEPGQLKVIWDRRAGECRAVAGGMRQPLGSEAGRVTTTGRPRGLLRGLRVGGRVPGSRQAEAELLGGHAAAGAAQPLRLATAHESAVTVQTRDPPGASGPIVDRADPSAVRSRDCHR
jgi:hypothetical protein